MELGADMSAESAEFGGRDTGRIVRSKAGHDKGWFFVVVAAERDRTDAGVSGLYYVLADGRERKLAKPKRKNARHVAVTSAAVDLADITDKKLRKYLHPYNFNAGMTRGAADTVARDTDGECDKTGAGA